VSTCLAYQNEISQNHPSASVNYSRWKKEFKKGTKDRRLKRLFAFFLFIYQKVENKAVKEC
jgi:hypothetical protein